MATLNYPPTSRYYGLPTATFTPAPGDDPIVYLTRRFVPRPDRFAQIGWHLVTQGERMDQIAAQELGDAEAFWRICDANAAMRPEDLTAPVGRRLRITLAEGIPAPSTGF
jgi:hypothetical protein